MTDRRAARIERVLDAVAAAIFAIAASYCAVRMSLGGGAVASITGLSLCGAFALLRAVHPTGRFRLAEFALAEVPDQPGELLLTEADRLVPDDSEQSPELLLDDVLAQLAPDSRVVRLFDPAAMPTAGELRARIDRHLDSSNARPAPHPDASQALHEALAELRRSLR